MRTKVEILFALVATLGSIPLASSARASLGGPEVAHPLGWDPVEQRAYFLIAGLNESGLPVGIVSFAPGGPPLGTVLPWSAGPADSTYQRKLRSLKQRLRALTEEPIPTVLYGEIVRQDSLVAFGTTWPRFRVSVRGAAHLFNGTLEVTTIGDPEVRVIRRYVVPKVMSIGIVSFRGLPFEWGYEVQVPAVLPGDRKALRIVRDELR